MSCQRAESPLKLAGFTNTRLFFQDCLAESDPDIETLWVAHVDSELRCVHLTHHDGDTQEAITSLGIPPAEHAWFDAAPDRVEARSARRRASSASCLVPHRRK